MKYLKSRQSQLLALFLVIVAVAALFVNYMRPGFVPFLGEIGPSFSGLILCAQCTDSNQLAWIDTQTVAGQTGEQACASLSTEGGTQWTYVKLYEQSKGQDRFAWGSWTRLNPDPTCGAGGTGQGGTNPTCGDGSCNGAETTSSCCVDCGCPQNYACQTNQCIYTQPPISPPTGEAAAGTPSWIYIIIGVMAIVIISLLWRAYKNRKPRRMK